MIRSSLAYIVVSSSRQRDHEEEEEDEELDLRLRKLSIEDEEEEEVESSINLSRQESSISSIQLNRQESTTESESSNRSATSTSPGTDQVVHPSSFITNKKEERQVLTSGTISGSPVEHVSTGDAGSTPPATQVEIYHRYQSQCKSKGADVNKGN